MNSAIRASNAKAFGYDRGALAPGIVHIGVGNFHRAHQAWYLHRLMQQGLSLDWAILGAGVREYDRTMREKLLAQGCATTLIELAPDDAKPELTGSMIDYLPIAPENGPLIAAMSDPRIRIVSMTVTEGGYYRDLASGDFDPDHPDIRHDADNLATPRTAFGAMIAALAARKASGAGPFTCLSCDNLQGNGVILRQTLIGLAKMSDPGLADWIGQNCSFPNNMVDCIVPATGPAEMALAASLGVEDAGPVTHENFRQWVIEDDFCAGRPEYEKVGVTFAKDVHAYEAMKLRILNAGHQVLGNAGELLGLEKISDCMAHPAVRGLFLGVMGREVAPFVDDVPGMTAADYITQTETRFANTAIHDTVRRVAFDGSTRHPGFLLPVIREATAAGASVDGLALVEALWSRMCAGFRADGSRIEPNDPQWAVLSKAALAAKDAPQAWLDQSWIYGELGQEPRFAAAFAKALGSLWAEGIEETIMRFVSSPA